MSRVTRMAGLTEQRIKRYRALMCCVMFRTLNLPVANSPLRQYLWISHYNSGLQALHRVTHLILAPNA